MDGLINILKPPGSTSHDVVAYLRKLFKTQKIGHTGTLDPGRQEYCRFVSDRAPGWSNI